MRTSESTAAFYKAFCSAQAQIKGAVKNSINRFLQDSPYADLAAIWGACKAGLSGEGIGVIQALEMVEGQGIRLAPSSENGRGSHPLLEVTPGPGFCCVTRLVHGESGEWIESTLPLILLKNDMQGLGSAFTYAKRIALGGLVGVWAEDDDGESSVGRGPSSRPQEQPRDDGRAAINEQFGKSAPAASSRPEPWPSLLARRVREVNQEWRNEQAIENVPEANRTDLLAQEEVVNGLVKRAISAEPPLLTEDHVTTAGKRDLTKAKAALVRLYRERPRKILAALEKYLAVKLQDGKDRLISDRGRGDALDTAPPGKGEAFEEALSN